MYSTCLSLFGRVRCLTLTCPLDLSHSSEDGEPVLVLEVRSASCGATFYQTAHLRQVQVQSSVPHCHIHSTRRVGPLDGVHYHLHHFCARSWVVVEVGSRRKVLAALPDYVEAESPESICPARVLMYRVKQCSRAEDDMNVLLA